MPYENDLYQTHRYTISTFAALYGLQADSVRYYEEKGLLTPARGRNGYRYYGQHDVWRMNVIMSLRRLGFSVERISRYFSERSVETTQALLLEEVRTIDERMAELKRLKKQVLQQQKIIQQAKSLPIDTIRTIRLRRRSAIMIEAAHSDDATMDLVMNRLSAQSLSHPPLIANHDIASVLSDNITARSKGHLYRGGLLFDKAGDYILPGGDYLSICYAGPTQSFQALAKLKKYALANHLQLVPPYLDMIWIDIHSTADSREFISEIQARILPEGPAA